MTRSESTPHLENLVFAAIRKLEEDVETLKKENTELQKKLKSLEKELKDRLETEEIKL